MVIMTKLDVQLNHWDTKDFYHFKSEEILGELRRAERILKRKLSKEEVSNLVTECVMKAVGYNVYDYLQNQLVLKGLDETVGVLEYYTSNYVDSLRKQGHKRIDTNVVTETIYGIAQL